MGELETFEFDFQALLNSMSPATRRNFERERRVTRAQIRLAQLFRWPRWPLLNIVWVFWVTLMDEGIKETVTPRWGAMTFAYLNDGMRPSLYHTILSVLRPDTTPIYPGGAPRKPSER